MRILSCIGLCAAQGARGQGHIRGVSIGIFTGMFKTAITARRGLDFRHCRAGEPLVPTTRTHSPTLSRPCNWVGSFGPDPCGSDRSASRPSQSAPCRRPAATGRVAAYPEKYASVTLPPLRISIATQPCTARPRPWVTRPWPPAGAPAGAAAATGPGFDTAAAGAPAATTEASRARHAHGRRFLGGCRPGRTRSGARRRRPIQLLQGDLEYRVGFGLDVAALRLELARFLAQQDALCLGGMFFSSVIKAALRISRHTTSGEKYE